RATWRSHEIADGVEDSLELHVVPLFQLVQPACQVGVGCGHPPQPDESAHDLDVDRDRPRAVQDTREHRDALLGEGVRRVSPTATTFEITICDLKDSVSAGLRRNMKSPGNRSGFRLADCTRTRVSTP